MSATVSTNAKSGKKHKHSDHDLWNAAYERLDKDEDSQKILAKYQKVMEKYLAEAGHPTAKLASKQGRSELMKLINAKAKKLQPQNSMCNKVVEFALRSKDIVSTGASASPPAAVAVGGLFVALSLGQNYLVENEKMLDCTETAARTIVRRAVAESQVQSKSPQETEELKELRKQLKSSFIDLYSKVLLVIAKLVYKLESKLQSLDSLFKWSDWASENTKIERLDVDLEKNLNAVYQHVTDASSQPTPYANKGRNNLHYNAQYGYDQLVAQLLQSNAFDVNSKTPRGWTALTLAAEGGTPSHTRCCRNILDMAGVDINSQNLNGRTALHIAARNGRVDNSTLLIKKNAKLGLKDNLYGRTALHLAADFGHHGAVEVLCKAKGINLNAQDNEGHTALHLATLKSKFQVMRVLTEAGAKIDVQDKKKRTAFLDAAEKGSPKCIKILQEHGADINQITGRGRWSALCICASQGHPKSLETLLGFPGIRLEGVNSQGRTALHQCIREGRTLEAFILCDKGAKVDTRDDNQRTPFLDAAKSGNLEVLKKLREKGADINQVSGKNGWSALHEAVNSNSAEVVAYLVTQGINRDIRVQGGYKTNMTARDIAASMDLPSIMAALTL